MTGPVQAHRVAAIDCGTNSVRLLISELDAAGQPRDVVRRMEIVRLGEGVDVTGRLGAPALERTRVALASYAVDIANAGVSAVRMVATSATRDAANADEFVALVKAELGVAPEVISGVEEAGLSFAGAVADLPAGDYLVADIGGGSTELVRGTHADGVAESISVDVGCVRMTERHLKSDPPTAQELSAAAADVRSALTDGLAAIGGAAGARLVGLAGSVTTVAALALDLPEYDSAAIHHSVIPYSEVDSIAQRLSQMTTAQRLAFPAMHPGRADVIVGGAMILHTLMQVAQADVVLVSEHDILDGIAASLRNPPRDLDAPGSL